MKKPQKKTDAADQSNIRNVSYFKMDHHKPTFIIL